MFHINVIQHKKLYKKNIVTLPVNQYNKSKDATVTENWVFVLTDIYNHLSTLN